MNTEKVLPRIIICCKPEHLKSELDKYEKTATIEAEYGNIVVTGSLVTLAHHSPHYKSNCPPCEKENMNFNGLQIIGLSHFDLDTLGGILAILGMKDSKDEPFWKLAGFIDTHGAHKISTYMSSNVSSVTSWSLDCIYSFWSYGSNNKILSPKDGTILDITENVKIYIQILNRILNNDQEMYNLGQKWLQTQYNLNKKSFIKSSDNVILRCSESFVNHIYEDPHSTAKSYKAIVGFSEKYNSITISICDPIEGFSCSEFMKNMFGPTAGGHSGIAGTPRDTQYKFSDAIKVFEEVVKILN